MYIIKCMFLFFRSSVKVLQTCLLCSETHGRMIKLDGLKGSRENLSEFVEETLGMSFSCELHCITFSNQLHFILCYIVYFNI